MRYLLLAVAALTAGTGPGLEVRLQAAARSWDLAAAEAVRVTARTEADDGDPHARLLHARACLLVAELLRVEWEQAAPDDRTSRQQLGQRIDVAAQEGLAELPGLPDTSERFRIEADLLATTIRSDFRARRLEARLRAAVERALTLDPENARALTASAKPLLFADPEHGGDVRKALEVLGRALEIDPGLEGARLLRALAWEKLGEPDRAAGELRKVLRRNPSCEPARHELKRLSLAASPGSGAGAPPPQPSAATPPPTSA